MRPGSSASLSAASRAAAGTAATQPAACAAGRPRCATCGRCVRLTFHHLIPRKLHRRNHFRRHYDRETLNQGIRICRACHTGIHRRFDEMTLARDYPSLERLCEDAVLARHFAWVARQKTDADS